MSFISILKHEFGPMVERQLAEDAEKAKEAEVERAAMAERDELQDALQSVDEELEIARKFIERKGLKDEFEEFASKNRDG